MLPDVNGYTINYMPYSEKSKSVPGMKLPYDVVTVNKDILWSGYIILCNSYCIGSLLFNTWAIRP